MTPTGLGPEIQVMDENVHTQGGPNYTYLLRPEAVESLYVLNKLTGDSIYRYVCPKLQQTYVAYKCLYKALCGHLLNPSFVILFFQHCREWGWEIFQSIEKVRDGCPQYFDSLAPMLNTTSSHIYVHLSHHCQVL